jgi:hypothetical protein
MNIFTHKTTKPMAIFNSCSHIVAADALLEIGTTVISAVLSLDEHLSQTNTSCVPKFCYQSVYCLIRYFLVRIRIAKCSTNSSKLFRKFPLRNFLHSPLTPYKITGKIKMQTALDRKSILLTECFICPLLLTLIITWYVLYIHGIYWILSREHAYKIENAC